MAIDRAAALRQAEKLLRLGKLEQAIAEYERVVEEQLGDLTTANALGDLYMRAGQQERAVQQFSRIAAVMERDGFLAKAGAIYKKILKLDPSDEATLLKSGEIAAAQGLLADARAHFNAVIRQRRSRQDEPGAAQITVRLASLDPLDIPARLAGAHARVSLGERAAAVDDLKTLVAELTEIDRDDDAARVLREILILDPADRDARGQIARASLASGDIDAVLQLIDTQGAAVDSALLLSAVETMIRAGRLDDALRAIDRLLAEGDAAMGDVVRLGAALAEERPAAGYSVVLRAADSAATRNDWLAAAGALNEFLHRVPAHVPSLTRLVEIAVDGGLDETLADAQARLADAYLESGRAAEARFIAEDIASRQPDDTRNRERLRRALHLLGEPDLDVTLAGENETVGTPATRDQHEAAVPDFDIISVGSDDTTDQELTSAHPDASIDLSIVLGDYRSPADVKQDSRSAEIDLSVALDGIVKPMPPVPVAAAPIAPAPADLDDVFAQLRDEAGRKPLLETAEQDLRRGQTLFQCGQFQECLGPLESAARVPRLQFESASLLGRALRSLERRGEALAWTERAAEAPPPTPEAGHRVLYKLADALEESGETTRALAICLELQAETANYADLPARIVRLSQAEARG